MIRLGLAVRFALIGLAAWAGLAAVALVFAAWGPRVGFASCVAAYLALHWIGERRRAR